MLKSDQYNQALRVLIVEDNELDRRILESMLMESPQLISSLKIVNSFLTASRILAQECFDVVILDLNLPDSRGENTLKDFVQQFPHMAIVVNTGAYEDEAGLKTLSVGAQDFLVKGRYSTYLLNKTLRYAIERKRLQLQLENALYKLQTTQSQLVQLGLKQLLAASDGPCYTATKINPKYLS